MKIVITGASGLVGSTLIPFLQECGHEVTRLVRSKPVGAGECYWDPQAGVLDPLALEGVDAIINLAGANVASGRWTEQRKRVIRESRVQGLRTLIEAIRQGSQRPSVVISASAAGIYGDRGDEWLDESAATGSGFLASVCRDWEAGLSDLKALGLRTVALRFGLVLSGQGGALAKMLPAFKFGVGGRLGSGRQWMSWIATEDLHRIVAQALENESWQGPINTVSPHPVTNAAFTKILAGTLNRPAIFPVPAMVLRLVFGEMAPEALLSSARLKPAFLLEHGYKYTQPDLSHTLRMILQETSN